MGLHAGQHDPATLRVSLIERDDKINPSTHVLRTEMETEQVFLKTLSKNLLKDHFLKALTWTWITVGHKANGFYKQHS